MLYLSKLILSSEQERKEDLYDIYRLHQKLWQAFEAGDGSKKRDFLFRIDSTNSRDKEILLQSATEPQWERLFPPRHAQVKNYSPKFCEGQNFFFYLRANAVVAKKQAGKKNSTKIPIRPRDYVLPIYHEEKRSTEYKGWLAEQGKKHGFELCEASRVGTAYAKGKKVKNQPIIQLTGQNLQGYLKITDADAFTTAYVQGLGRGKAFGFGMLSLMKG